MRIAVLEMIPNFSVKRNNQTCARFLMCVQMFWDGEWPRSRKLETATLDVASA
jgi:hypothetical protein